jgi:hypothetical protein
VPHLCTTQTASGISVHGVPDNEPLRKRKADAVYRQVCKED